MEKCLAQCVPVAYSSNDDSDSDAGADLSAQFLNPRLEL